VLQWYVVSVNPDNPAPFQSAQIAAKLARREDAAAVSARIVELMSVPQSQDMFWMFPWTAISYLGRDQLTPAAKRALCAQAQASG